MNGVPNLLARRLPFFYGYVVAVLAVLTTICSSPGQTFAISAFTPYLQESLGLSSSTLAAAYMLGTFLAAFPLAIIGPVSDRFGIRTTSIIVSIGLALACWWISRASGFYTLFTGFLLLRFLGQGSLSLLANNMVSMWFHTKLGRVNAVMSIGGTLAFGIVPIALVSGIATFGWRTAFVTMGFCVALTLLPALVLLLKNRPEDMGLLPDGSPATRPKPRESGPKESGPKESGPKESGPKESGPKESGPKESGPKESGPNDLSPSDLSSSHSTPSRFASSHSEPGENYQLNSETPSTGSPAVPLVRDLTLGEAMSHRTFWIMTTAMVAWALIGTGIVFYAYPIFEQYGIGMDRAKLLFTTFSIAMLAGQVAGGVLADRMQLHRLITAGFASLLLGAMVIPCTTSVWHMHTFAGFFGLGQGVVLASSSTMWVRYYGREHLGKIRGAIWCCTVAGSGCGPFVLGVLHDATDSYTTGLWLFALAFVPLVPLLLFATSPQDLPPKKKNENDSTELPDATPPTATAPGALVESA